jgi:Pyridoxamine 5'-phosphate oxidase
MEPDRTQLESLSRDKCLRLLKSAAVGRIIYTRQALPAVELVNFAVDGGDIVIRTSRSGKLAAAVSPRQQGAGISRSCAQLRPPAGPPRRDLIHLARGRRSCTVWPVSGPADGRL